MEKEITDLRESYALSTLSRKDLLLDPMDQFKKWFDQARESSILEPNAMVLATVNKEGLPSARVVLLKEIESDGIVFYTNYESQKAKDIAANPQVAVCFLWKEIQRQVRMEGTVSKVNNAQSLKYFQSRPKASQIGAWASSQSSEIENRDAIEARQKELEEKYKDVEVLPLPPFWGGYKIKISACEFWQGRRSRLHDRFRYEKKNEAWNIKRLSS